MIFTHLYLANMIEGENCPPYETMKFLEGAQLVKARFLDFFPGDDKRARKISFNPL